MMKKVCQNALPGLTLTIAKFFLHTEENNLNLISTCQFYSFHFPISESYFREIYLGNIEIDKCSMEDSDKQEECETHFRGILLPRNVNNHENPVSDVR